jgi:AmmeMemoRadiSam system protein B/uncharacterized protein (TIGR00296 family)
MDETGDIFTNKFVDDPRENFINKFVEHIPNVYYGIEPQESKLFVIAKAQRLLTTAKNELYSHVNSADVKAILVPHSGFDYSGICMASAYSALLRNSKKINRVVILSTRHSGKAGILIPDLDYFTFNYHKFKIDNSLYGELSTTSGITICNDIEFLEEHSLEIQMPFIYNLFNASNIKFVPMLVGELNDKQLIKISEILKKYDSDNTIWIISSDMMHVNGQYEYKMDNSTLSDSLIRYESQYSIHFLNPTKLSYLSLMKYHNRQKKKPTICGINAIILWTYIAQDMGLIGKITSYYSSLHIKKLNMMTQDKLNNEIHVNLQSMFHRFIDTTDEEGCVSYLGAVYIPLIKNQSYLLNNYLTAYEKMALVDFVKRIVFNIANNITLGNPYSMKMSWQTPSPIISGTYLLKLASYVTFKNKNKNKMRGCIGTMSEEYDILTNITKYAGEAGFNDIRSGLTKDNPLTANEIYSGALQISINLLGAPKLLSDGLSRKISNDKLIEQWQIGKDGIMIYDIVSNKTASYLPHVPHTHGWNIHKTMEELSKKAGLLYNDWKKDTINIYVISGYEFSNNLFD